MRGKFITFEGGEGAGKSTQIQELKKQLEAQGFSVVMTREPGGSAGAELLREILLSGQAQRYGVDAEAVLFAAARADHIDTVISPALCKGQWVLCDRFADSSRVYQGEAGVEKTLINHLQSLAINENDPDLTILIDVPVDIGMSRVTKRSDDGPDRFEQDTTTTHERRRALFLSMAGREVDRFVVVDGCQDAATVSKNILNAVCGKFPSYMKEATLGSSQ
ncbi:dTMP kinase [Flexibacterium corallicola]|uniref:dTMP kinase n=1 Tax=Flexibacterium corallicola TaxID=3037259 RepID=UPI00286F97E3|nr:dTMP kinase [Pseudovibrio sp. M1P-2-3]